jgi:hypothetical protein
MAEEVIRRAWESPSPSLSKEAKATALATADGEGMRRRSSTWGVPAK